MRSKSELKQVKIPATHIKMGMYVSALDRPWSESPFLMQGFCVTSSRVLAKLQDLCEYVIVDSTKSIGDSLGVGPSKTGSAHKFDTRKADEPVQKSAEPIPVNRKKYTRRSVMTTTDVTNARKSYTNVKESINTVFQGVSENSSLDSKSIEKASSALVNSAVRYPSALSWLALMQKSNDKIYSHALRSSTWALLCGRHMGVAEPELKYLTLAIMLKDIGNLKSDSASSTNLNTKDMTREEVAIARTVALVTKSTKNPKVLSIIETYREKFNGTGKPKGLRGEQIPLLSRIASIAIAYDLLLNPIGTNRAAFSPSEAAKYIYAQRGRAFQDELAVLFIEALGTYPLGTLLQLDSGEIGVVVDHDKKARLKPTIMVVADEFGNPIEDWRIVKLSQQTNVEGDSGKPSITKIMRDLSADNLDLDMQKIQDKYQELRTGKSKKTGNSGILSKLLHR